MIYRSKPPPIGRPGNRTVAVHHLAKLLLPHQLQPDIAKRPAVFPQGEFGVSAAVQVVKHRLGNPALRESAQDPRFRDAMTKINVTVDYLDGDALKAWYEEELKRLEREIRAIGKIEGRN